MRCRRQVEVPRKVLFYVNTHTRDHNHSSFTSGASTWDLGSGRTRPTMKCLPAPRLNRLL
ncbi:hypothetical protein BDN71DRAFT_1452295 [Pleurotus eryngii]|uniref:Uncharacterized protein n=1 Tax=Pleurotus eryngii TaxID=5323 RepID=A0A9P5ZQJ4_PLEER|nr:hypothetical protein BDN71DRAFT_1452295 [Pleurotus eryngii]